LGTLDRPNVENVSGTIILKGQPKVTDKKYEYLFDAEIGKARGEIHVAYGI